MDTALLALLVLALTNPLPLSSTVLLTFALAWGACRFVVFLLEEHTHHATLKERDRLDAELPARRARAFQDYLDSVEAKRVAAVAADAEAAAADPARQAWLDWIDRLPPITAPPLLSPTQAAPRRPALWDAPGRR